MSSRMCDSGSSPLAWVEFSTHCWFCGADRIGTSCRDPRCHPTSEPVLACSGGRRRACSANPGPARAAGSCRPWSPSCRTSAKRRCRWRRWCRCRHRWRGPAGRTQPRDRRLLRRQPRMPTASSCSFPSKGGLRGRSCEIINAPPPVGVAYSAPIGVAHRVTATRLRGPFPMSARSGRVVWCWGVPPTPFGLWGSIARRRRALDGGPPLERSREWGSSYQGFSATRRGAVPGHAARAGIVKGPLKRTRTRSHGPVPCCRGRSAGPPASAARPSRPAAGPRAPSRRARPLSSGPRPAPRRSPGRAG